MAKREKDSNDALDQTGVAAVATVEATEDARPTAPLSQKILAMNTSPTLLHLDDGSPFPSRTTAELTPAEFARFSNFKLVAPK
ncbi:MAG: hypothetical protein HY231_23810 [Acidobacteria bacterium]|nr:hypothetical protein [Acidobacteriota bacterium]